MLTDAATNSKFTNVANWQGMNLADILDKSYCYLTGPSKPTFNFNADHIDVSFNANSYLDILTTKGRIRFNCPTDTYSVQNNGERLVMNITNGEMYVASPSSSDLSGHIITLLAYTKHVVQGYFSSYFNKWQRDSIREYIDDVNNDLKGNSIEIKTLQHESKIPLCSDYSKFRNGTIDGGTALNSKYKYRICTYPENIEIFESSTLYVESGFRVYVWKKNDDESFTGLGWKQQSYNIEPGYYKFVIARQSEDTSEMADIVNFASKVYFDKNTYKDFYLSHYAYFTGPKKPSFSINTDYSINVTLPNTGELKIFNKNGNVKNYTLSSGLSYDINRAAGRLVINIDDDNIDTAIYVRTSTSSDDNNKKCFILLSYNGYGCSGLLANYYYRWLIDSHPNDILYWHNDDNFLPKLRNISFPQKYRGTVGIKPLTILHCSDNHASNAQIEELVELKEHYGTYIDDMIHTGDSVQAWFNEPSGNIWDWSGFGNKIMNVIGNHDAWVSPSGTPNATASQCYQKFFAPYISEWGLTQYTENICYYYKDYAVQNVRLIVLDGMHWDSSQLSWLTNVLNDAKTNSMHVIIASHFLPCSYRDLVDAPDSGFNSLDDTPTDNMYLNSEAYAAVQTFIENGGIFVCWMAGHVHTDYMGFVPNTNKKQFAYAVNDSLWQSSGNGDRTSGTKARWAADLIGIDVTSRELKFVRIGMDLDRNLRKIDTLVYSYGGNTFIKI